MRYPTPRRYRDYLLRPFHRGHCVALDGLSLRIGRGECLAVLGANGAGKTTLLKLIGGLLYPSQGSVTVNGHDTRTSNLRARQSVGYVLNEERSFYWRLTGIQNLEFFAAMDNLWGQARRQRIRELLQLVGLERAGQTRVSDYSCGMRQRLAIARGLLADPEVLILDEPTRALAPIGAQDMRRLISRKIHAGQGKTLIIATHHVGEAEMLCNFACVIDRGRVADHARVEDIKHRSGGVEGFYRSAVTGGERVPC